MKIDQLLESPVHVTTSARSGVILLGHAEQHPHAERLASAPPPYGACSNHTQIITTTDRQGREILVPANVNVGSKAESQRRKRNADASARVRSKSKRIIDLEKQLQNALKQVENLTAERNYLCSIVERDRTRNLTPQPSRS